MDNALDDGNNTWNIPKTSGTSIIGGAYLGGNYWSDYYGNDTNGDGLGDTSIPYNSLGNIQNGGDWLPLTEIGPIANPSNLVASNPTANSISLEWTKGYMSGTHVHDLLYVDNFTKYGGNPLFNKSDTGSWASTGIRENALLTNSTGHAVKVDGKYVMYFNGRTSTPVTTTRIGRANSTDGENWDVANNYVFNDTGGYNYTFIGSVIQRGENDYIMYYGSRNETSESIIKYATSTDSITWIVQNEILNETDFTDVISLNIPYVIYFDSEWHMVMEGDTADSEGFKIFYANSSDGEIWTAKADAIYSGSVGEWDSEDAANPSLYKVDTGKYVIFYNGNSQPSGYIFDLGVLYSTSITSGWTSWKNNPILEHGPESEWDDTRLEGPRIFMDDIGNATLRLWYFGLPTGNSFSNGAIGYAVCNETFINTMVRYSTSDNLSTYTDGSLGYNGTDSYTTVTGLDSDTKYYFRAWSWNETQGWNETGSNTTNLATLGNTAPIQTGEDPGHGSSGINVTPPLYVICLDDDADTMNATWWSNSSGSWIQFASNSSIGNNTNITQTNSNFSEYFTTYYWSLNLSDGNGGFCNNTYHFTTEIGWDNTSPEITDVIDFPDPQETSGYVNITCCVNDNVDVNTVKVNITYPDSSYHNETMLGGLGGSYYYNATYAMGGTYDYFIWANDTSSNSNISTNYTFEIINQPPYTPSNPSPSNGTTGISITADLSWAGGDPDSGDTVTYDVYFGTTSSPPEVSSNQSATTYNPGTMNYEETYYWEIIAWDSNNLSTSGPLWHFTTREEHVEKPTANFTYYPINPIENELIYFTDTSNDSDGTIVNWSWDFGDENISYGDRALNFDGTDDYIETDGMYLNGSRTFEIWIKPDFPYDDGKKHEWISWHADGTYMHGFKNSDGKTLFVIESLSWRAASKIIPFEAGSWHHFVGVYNMTNDTIYLHWDGELVASSQGSGELASTEANFYIGKTGWSTRWFDGVIDDVRIYNRPLSSSEIQDNYNGSVSTSGLVSWWKMNDTGDIATDSIGGNDGTIYGSAWTNHADHRYTSDGTYQVNLTVMDNEGATDKISKNVTVSPLAVALTADFSYHPTNPTTSDMVSFNDLSTDTDGTIVNWSWDFGDENISYGDRALNFDGTDDYIETDGMYLNGSRTFEIWIKPDFPYDDGKKHEWISWHADGTYMHGFKNSDGKTLFVIESLSWRAASKIIPFEAGSWHHFVGVYNMTNDTIYLHWDGELVASSQGSGELASTEANFYIGKTGWSTRWFDGVIDDVRIYNRPLSSSEIQDNYNGSVSTSGLVSWWKMNDTGDIATDSIGGNDGTIYGSAWTNHADHRYTSDGTYQVNLTVMDNEGATDSISKPVTVSDY